MYIIYVYYCKYVLKKSSEKYFSIVKLHTNNTGWFFESEQFMSLKITSRNDLF